MSEPRWLGLEEVLVTHERQLGKFGGAAGIRDQGALESALGRPLNKYSYGETDLVALGAAYAFGIAPNHPFVVATSVSLSFRWRRFFVLTEHGLRRRSRTLPQPFSDWQPARLKKPVLFDGYGTICSNRAGQGQLRAAPLQAGAIGSS
jgi:hypothetical protein